MATDSQLFEYDLNDLEGTEFYNYVSVPDNGIDSVNVANQVLYIEPFIVIIFALGVIAGLFFGWVSSWKI